MGLEKRADGEAGRVLDEFMKTCVVMTVLAPDRPGIVKRLSEVVAARGGNWLESRMARMAGQFAGIVRIECEEEVVEELLGSLRQLEGEGFSLQARREAHAPDRTRELLTLDIVGNDRPGIVRELSAAIASAGANVEELYTSLESAPMSGHPIFHAKGIVSLPDGRLPGPLVAAIEDLGEDLAVTIGE